MQNNHLKWKLCLRKIYTSDTGKKRNFICTEDHQVPQYSYNRFQWFKAMTAYSISHHIRWNIYVREYPRSFSTGFMTQSKVCGICQTQLLLNYCWLPRQQKPLPDFHQWISISHLRPKCLYICIYIYMYVCIYRVYPSYRTWPLIEAAWGWLPFIKLIQGSSKGKLSIAR